jgi:xanthine dehydrogenase YagT iron-sulfur-binding subunit
MKTTDDLTRREFVGVAAVAATLTEAVAEAAATANGPGTQHYSLTINGQLHQFDLEPRVTLLDLLRERLHLTGTKKGCDHGQCGACTVLIGGARVNSCLTLAVTQDGSHVTTIEGLATNGGLHPMQTAFIERDGFQCGFCTAGQICSAVAMLNEWKSGMPSVLGPGGAAAQLSDAEIRERMAGNICRCGAYPNIVAAIGDVHRSAVHSGAMHPSPVHADAMRQSAVHPGAMQQSPVHPDLAHQSPFQQSPAGGPE